MLGRFAVLFCAGLLSLSGCKSAAPEPTRSVTLSLEIGKTRTSLTARVGDVITLELLPVELAGYGWQVFLLDTRFFKQLSEVTPPAAGATRPTVRLRALAPTQKTTIRFLLVKLDGAKETQPIDGHDAVFSID
jgi:hypothetical protein